MLKTCRRSVFLNVTLGHSTAMELTNSRHSGELVSLLLNDTTLMTVLIWTGIVDQTRQHDGFQLRNPERHQTAIWSVHLYVIVTVMLYVCRFVCQCTVWSAFSSAINFRTDTTGSNCQHDLQPRAMHVMRVSCPVNVPFDVIAENHCRIWTKQFCPSVPTPPSSPPFRLPIHVHHSRTKTVYAEQLGFWG